jgi:transposase InsO family protein
MFEFTAPGTPQQNGKVERSFATLFGMLNLARFTIPFRKGLWAKFAHLSVQLECIIFNYKGQKYAAEKVWYKPKMDIHYEKFWRIVF